MSQEENYKYKESEETFSRNIYHFLIITALFIATIYRLHDINRFSLWADELWGVLACSRGSWAAMMQDLIANDNHPPGYQTILYFVMKGFGDSETVIRMPSVMAGIITVYVVYCAGKRLFSVNTGIVAAFMVTCSYQAIFYSQEARAYMLLALFCTLNIYYFLRLFVVEKITNQNTLLFTLTGAMCIFLHYAGLLFVASEALVLSGFMLFGKNKKNMLMSALYAYGLLILLYIKWVPVMMGQMHHDEFYWEVTPTIYSVYQTIKYLLGPDDFRSAIEFAAMVLALGVACKGLHKYRRLPRTDHKIVLGLFFAISIPLVAVFIKSIISSSIYTHRYFIYLIPQTSLLAGYGLACAIDKLSTKNLRQWGLVITLIVITVTGVWFNRNLYADAPGKQDFRGAVKMVAEDGDFISRQGAVIASHEFFDYYLKKLNKGKQAQGYLLFQSQIPQILKKINQLAVEEFYYLEVSSTEQTPINKILDGYYHRMSYNRVMEINVIKYRVIDK